jgi:hypothetical protein
MIKLIVTASDPLYEALSEKVRAEGQTPRRARNVLQGYEQASSLVGSQSAHLAEEPAPQDKLAGIVVDMSLRAADTLLEALHSRQGTSGIPLVAVKCSGQALPLALRRLCTNILEPSSRASPGEQEMRQP